MIEVIYPPQVQAELDKCQDMLHEFEQAEMERLLRQHQSQSQSIMPRPEVAAGFVLQVLEHPFRQMLIDLMTRIHASNPRVTYFYPAGSNGP